VATTYNIYKNDGLGGPVDYGTIVATTSSLSYVGSALPLNSDTTFAVRTYDTVSGLEDANTDCRVRIVVDGSGNDVTNRPNAPIGVTARLLAAGGLRVEWAYSPAGQAGAPTQFKVWATLGGAVNYAAAPNATVAYQAGRLTYSATVPGLTGGSLHSIGVRASNASGDETNATAVQATPDSTAPSAPTGLAGSATY